MAQTTFKTILEADHPLDYLLFNRHKFDSFSNETDPYKKNLHNVNCKFGYKCHRGLYCDLFHTKNQLVVFNKQEIEENKVFKLNPAHHTGIKGVFNRKAFDAWFEEIKKFIGDCKSEWMMIDVLERWIGLSAEEREFWAIDDEVVRNCLEKIFE
jgi:hypothetical protein